MSPTLFLIGVLVPLCIVAVNKHLLLDSESTQLLLENQSNNTPKKNSEFAQPFNEIKNIREFLEKSLKRKVLKYTTRPLTKPGDNYNSLLHAIKVDLLNKSNKVGLLIDFLLIKDLVLY